MLSSTQPTTCPHCNAVLTSAQARFCGKCGKPFVAPPPPTTVLPVPAPQALPPVPPTPVQKWVPPPRHTPQVTSLAPQGFVSQVPASQATTTKVPAPGSPLAVITPAFPAPITPAFNYRPRRIRFACIASPIIGVGLGAEPAGLLAIGLINAGLPEVILPILMTVGFSAVTALIAYIIMADKLAFISALMTRRRIESVDPIQPIEAITSDHTELDHGVEVKRQRGAENPHQWAKQEGWNKSEL